MTEPILATENLTKDYGPFRALSALTLSVAPGEVVGLLGPNGSGKSTALRLVLGFLRPTAGRARIGGFDCWADSVEARKRVAYLPGELRLYDTMTGRRLVTFLAQLRGGTPGTEVDDLAKKLDIDVDRPLTQMSSGMKRKVALLAVLVPKVPLIILDEPTNTLDPTMRDELLDQLKAARDRGQAVLFSSHVLQEVEAVCDRVAILRRGELVHTQEMSSLREGRSVSAQLTGTRPATGPDGSPLSADAISRDGRLQLTFRGPLPALLDWLAKQPLADLVIEPQGLTPIYKKFHG
ncbi:ABC transporter ATP-binding protein [Gemmata sp. G18]|uniref:ABC transporter ATP-binding protein n=1 Tax=Gemmata palustris TaxID=2822762 RepID=A0ABS5C0I4_9BACT|nr:ABC transporter ATP-binding protein [Gemmata palustris]MBP3959464.1 ABC transporter ATP-binding protein [Gemmata palustris]